MIAEEILDSWLGANYKDRDKMMNIQTMTLIEILARQEQIVKLLKNKEAKR